MSKDFVNTIPLISLLGAKSMRERHWNALKVVTKKDFVPPYADKKLLLGGILALKLHEFSGDVEDICDQAAKELKIEVTINALNERWLGIEWLMDPYKDTDIPLLKMAEEDFESLEADQLTVQGMLASRFVKQFEEDAQKVGTRHTSEKTFLAACQEMGFSPNWSFVLASSATNIIFLIMYIFVFVVSVCSGKSIWRTLRMCSCWWVRFSARGPTWSLSSSAPRK